MMKNGTLIVMKIPLNFGRKRWKIHLLHLSFKASSKEIFWRETMERL